MGSSYNLQPLLEGLSGRGVPAMTKSVSFLLE